MLKHSWLICLKFVCHFLAELYYLILKSSVLLRFSQTCKFWSSKAAFTIAFFAAINHLNRPLRKENFTITGSKGHGLWFSIHFVCLCVSRFVACNRNYDWRQQKTQLLWRRLLNFRVHMFVKSAVNDATHGKLKFAENIHKPSSTTSPTKTFAIPAMAITTLGGMEVPPVTLCMSWKTKTKNKTKKQKLFP